MGCLPPSGVAIWLLAHVTYVLAGGFSRLAPYFPGAKRLLCYVSRRAADRSLECFGVRVTSALFGWTTWWLSSFGTWPIVRTSAASPDYCEGINAPQAVWYDLRGLGDHASPHELIIAYVHGGGFCIHTATEPLFAAAVLPRLAIRGVRARVLALDYSLAPASRATQLAQLLHAWTQLTLDAPPEATLVLAGDSAGGHLALAMAHAMARPAPASGAPAPHDAPARRRPDALLAISPWLHVVRSAAHRSPPATRPRTDYLSELMLAEFARAAGHTANLMLPGAAGSLLDGPPPRHTWPRTAIWVGGDEHIGDDGRRLATALRRQCEQQQLDAARHVTLFDAPGAVHDGLLLPWYDATPGDAARQVEEVVAWIESSLRDRAQRQ